MTDKPPGWSPARVIVVTALLIAPFVGTLWVGSFARTEPTLIGFPFFYWYLMAWVIVSALCTGLAYVLTRQVERARHAWRRARTAENGRKEEDGK